MPTRRKVLGMLGAAAVAPLVSGEEKRHRSRWDLIFNADPTEQAPLHPDPSSWRNDTITAVWIGHSTVLLNFFGTWIITDPVFSERVGLRVAGLFTVGPKRLVAPALPLENLPKIDLILLSHAHMDHLDLPSLREFDPSIPLVMAKNTSDVIGDLDFTTVYELDWGKWTNAAGIRIEALRVSHFGWRFPWEEDRSRGTMDGRSYNAYLLSKNGRHIVFGGDTAYQEYFKALAGRNLEIDLAMMPIGSYDPWIRNHANPEQALAMAGHMRARYMLPMHWNTFIQSDEPRLQPIQRLQAAAEHSSCRIALESIGQTWSLPLASADGRVEDVREGAAQLARE